MSELNQNRNSVKKEIEIIDSHQIKVVKFKTSKSMIDLELQPNMI